MTAKADRIKELLDDPHIVEAFDNVRGYYRRAIEDLNVSDEDSLEARRMLFLLNSVEQDLKKSVDDGLLEDFNATEDERPSFLGELWNRKQARH